MPTLTTSGWTSEQYRVYARDHLLYSAQQAVLAASALSTSSNPSLSRVITNSLVESFAVNVRVLIDFLHHTKATRDDDVLSVAYLGKAALPELPPSLKTARDQASKQIVHPTAVRSAVAALKHWRCAEIPATLLPEMEKFAAAAAKANPERVDSATLADIVSLARSHKFGSGSISAPVRTPRACSLDIDFTAGHSPNPELAPRSPSARPSGEA